ncbi:MAG: BTAD domain-containing putative transcriptional regulator [Roseiflexaceae bacterium]
MSQDGSDIVLRVLLLGGFRVAGPGGVVTAAELRLRAAQQVIKLLALAPGYRLHREQVLAALWPDQEPHAAVNSLNQALYVARRALAPLVGTDAPLLTLRDQQLRLGDPAQVWVDAVAFEAAARHARQQRDSTGMLEAIELYGGELLPEDPYDPWLDTRRAVLRQTFRSLALELAQADVRPAVVARVRDALQLALVGDPADEELHRALMGLAARNGDRQAAIRQYGLLERALRHDLGLEPDPLSQQLYRDILDGRFAPALPSATVAQTTLPPLPLPLTSFVGRTREQAEVRQLLGGTRLLTIAGVGGGGKTRLALEVARAEAASYRDGVAFVALAALADPMLLDQELARALGLREGQGPPLRDQLLAFLAPRRMLLVLDNCEHLIDACALLAETLLQRCPELRLLATSREPLHIGGEVVWLIPALSLPDPRLPPPTRADLPQYGALQLFLDRAGAAWAQFSLPDAEIPLLAQICARLDGLPLAIELAAARVPAFSLDQIAARLDDRFALLRGGSRTALTRQQTLRAAIDWSHGLLAAPERLLFRRLAVFAGGWTLEAAEAVCAGTDLPQAEVLPLLAQLVDKSLVVARDTGGTRRYLLLETIRQYALEQLAGAGEEAALRERHQGWCLGLAAQGQDELSGPQQVRWLERLTAELDNFRAALQWTSAGDQGEPALLLGYRLFWFWYLHSAIGEGRAVFEAALARRDPDEPSWARAVALLGSGSMALYQGDLPLARARLEASLPIFRTLDDHFSRALAPFLAGTVAVNQGDYPAAEALLEECLPGFEALGHHQGLATALLHLGDVALGRDDPDAAEAHYRRCLAIHRADTGSTWGMGQALNNQGEVARYRGDLEAAADFYWEALALFRRLATLADVARTLHNQAALALAEGALDRAEAGFRESLGLFQTWGNCRGVVECMSGLAQVRLAQGDHERAATIMGFVAGYFDAMGAAMWPPDRLAFARARAALGREVAPAWARGRGMRLEEAVALATAV